MIRMIPNQGIDPYRAGEIQMHGIIIHAGAAVQNKMDRFGIGNKREFSFL
jgi:hypothetical protein